MDTVAVKINAPAEKVYDLITDVTQMGRWSPECTGGKWTGGVPVLTRPPLALELAGLSERQPIPPALYRVVAELLADALAQSPAPAAAEPS